jgi:hypothetical protein
VGGWVVGGWEKSESNKKHGVDIPLSITTMQTLSSPNRYFVLSIHSFLTLIQSKNANIY